LGFLRDHYALSLHGVGLNIGSREPPAAETLELDHPLAATILYRALLDDILGRARSPAYGHAARYLEKLDALAAHGDSASSIDPHHAYRAALSQKHGRKSGFWSLVKVRK
jgi:hypothetical protein